MASSDSYEEYSDEEDSEYSDYDDDDDDEDEEDASDDDEEASDSEYSLDDDDDEEEEEEEEDEEDEDGDEEEGEGEVRDEGKGAALNAETEVGRGDDENQDEDEQDVPALEHASKEPDEISQHTDGPFSGQSTPDVPPNELAVEKGADSSLTDLEENAESGKNPMEAPNIEDLSINTKINDPSEPSAEVPTNATIDDRSAVKKNDI